jgi:predicted esterase
LHPKNTFLLLALNILVMIKTFCALLLAVLFWNSSLAAKPGEEGSTQKPQYKYLVYIPQQYDSLKDKKWPLIIYLHGRSACGNDLSKVSRYGLPFFTNRGMQLDAIAVSPQCPEGKNWVSDDWFEPFLKKITAKYHIDTCRIYLTGMSLGGFGTWDLAIKYPHRFAAIAPLCGGGRPQLVCAIKGLPTWVFHGDKDEQVPISRSEEMVEALRKCGGKPKFTVMKGYPHDIHRVFGDERLYHWMLQYRLGDPVKTDGKQPLTNDTIVKNTSGETAPPKKIIKKEQPQPVKEASPKLNKSKGNPKEQLDTIKSKNFMITF